MESSVNSTSSTTTTTPSTVTPASSFVNLFLNEINNQDISGLLSVQRSL
jgi:flagellar hook assembly protein FlgD